MSLPRLIVKDHDAETYPTYWGIIEKDGRLFVCGLEGDDWETCESNLRKLAAAAQHRYWPRAVARFTHPAYVDPTAARQHAVDLILEEAERVLGTPAALTEEGGDA